MGGSGTLHNRYDHRSEQRGHKESSRFQAQFKPAHDYGPKGQNDYVRRWLAETDIETGQDLERSSVQRQIPGEFSGLYLLSTFIVFA